MPAKKISGKISRKLNISSSTGQFPDLLLKWSRQHSRRDMPWKGEKDPYRIWLSEVILQQTRVSQGLKYYENFISRYPSIDRLAAASEDEVFKLWEGLGYYSRCRNLIATARKISSESGGVFPDTYEEIMQLKGVGAYTAAAVASFAYNLPHAVVDGNVLRVLSRIFYIEIPIDSSEGKRLFADLAQSLLPVAAAGEYNQAIMDFGALICKPAPECTECFFQARCGAYIKSAQRNLPVKLKKTTIRERWFNYFFISAESHVLIGRRTANDIWQQLYEFPLIETSGPASAQEALALSGKEFVIKDFELIDEQGSDQKLTHQLIHFRFYGLSLKKKLEVTGYQWVNETDLGSFAFPRTLQTYIVGRRNAAAPALWQQI
jgi:A/G-specific adenine glycosylase